VRSAVKVKPAATARRLVRTQAARRPVAHRSRSTAGLVKRPRSGRSDLVPGLVMAPAATTTTPPPVAPHALSVTAPGRSPGTPTVRPSPQDPGVSLPDAGGLLPPVLPADGALQTAVDDAMTSVPQLPGVDVGDVTAHVPLGLGG
jgi:hypothetical protein